MKGMIFTEFLEMVEDRFSADVVDNIIEASELESGGVYTSIGTYGHEEMLTLVTQLSKEVNIPVPDLVQAFGLYLFGRFASSHTEFFSEINSTFAFLSKVENYIHIEVRKLYPGAQLPSFEYNTSQENQMVMTYNSTRPFADLAEGLINGCIAHFKEDIEVKRENLADNGTSARFTLSKKA